MQRIFTTLILALLVASIGSAAVADDLYLACHAGVTLATADVRDMFLGEKQFFNTVRLVPVDNMASQPAFLETVLKMDGIKYATTWAKKSFRDGINPPAVMANDAAVLEFIRRTPGGCGYVGIAPIDGITVIARFSSP